jgi:PAS domain S-box-containing protein
MNKREINVLFVDDSREDFARVRDLLHEIKNWKFNLESVGDYETAWEKAKANRYDICMFTYQLDRRDGILFLQRVIEHELTTAPILLVNQDDHRLAADFLEVGAVDYLVKEQIDIPLLKRAVRYALQNKQLADSVRSGSNALVEAGTNGSGSAQPADPAPASSSQPDDVQDRVFFNLDVYGIEILDVQGKILDCNETYQRLLGYSRKEIIGQHTTAFATENSKKIFARDLMILKKKGYAEGEIELVKKDGAKIIVWRRYRAIYDKAGQYTKIVSYNRNITERLKAVRQISLLARALEQSPVALLITDRRGVIEYVNFKFTEITEHSYDDVVGKDIRSLETEWQAPDDLKAMWNTIKAGEEWRGEWYNLTKSGEVYWEGVTVLPMFSPKGHITNYIFVKENITRRKEIESATLHTQHRMGALMNEQLGDLNATNEALRHEVSERKRAEQELRQSEARLKAQFKGIPLPTYAWEKRHGNYILVDYNDAADKDSQGGIVKLLGKTAREIFLDRPEVLEDFDRCAADKGVVRREGPYQLVTTGENKFFITTYNFIPPNIIIVHIEDITHFKKTEEDLAHYREQLETPELDDTSELAQLKKALRYEIARRESIEQQARENEDRLKLIASSIDDRLREQYRTIPIPTYSWKMIGGEFVLIDFNDAAAKAMGRIVDFWGKTAREIFIDRPQVLADFKRCYEEKGTLVREAPYQLVTSGETRFFITTYNFLPPNLVIVHIQDATEQKQTETQLAETTSLLKSEIGKRQEMETHLTTLRLELDQLRHEFVAQRGGAESRRQTDGQLKAQYQGVPVPAYTWQRQGQRFVLIDYNEAAARANSSRIHELMGQPADQVFKNRQQVLIDFERCFREKRTIRRDAMYRLVGRDEMRHFITTYHFVDPDLVQVYIQDVTEFKQPEEGSA